MFSAADFLHASLKLPVLEETIHELPDGGYCVLSGQRLARGVLVRDVITSATAEFLDCFRGQIEGYISVEAATVFRSASPAAGNLAAKSHYAILEAPGQVIYHSPGFSADTAARKGVVTWSQMLRQAATLDYGKQAYLLATPDFKKRLWPYSRPGVIGAVTPIYILNPKYNVSGQFFVDIRLVVKLLDWCEEVILLGFTKTSCLNSLFSAHKVAEKHGVKATAVLDARFQPYRGTIELKLAAMCAVAPLKPVSTKAAPAPSEDDEEDV
jgi:hypothetical protein